MKTAVSTAVMRESDRLCIEGGTPATELMGRAGQAIFDSWHWEGENTAILCGSGNNGGDGFVLAHLLHSHQYACTVFLAGEKTSSESAFFLETCRREGVPVRLWNAATTLDGFTQVADCLFGTGFHGVPSGTAAEMIRVANQSALPILAVDIPSGLQGDNGLAEGECIHAVCTVALGARKYGHFLAMGKDICGTVLCKDIGIPLVGPQVSIPEAADFQPLFPPRTCHSHKGTYGYVAVMGGCREYSGAVKLANRSQAALRCGCGVAKLITAESVLPAVLPHLLESTAVGIPDTDGHMLPDYGALENALAHTASLAVGMGWGNGPHNRDILTWILENYEGRLILDADGLNTLGTIEPEMRQKLLRSRTTPPILTPHPMEFQRISGIPMGETAKNPVDTAMTFAAQMGVILLLKGTATIVTDGQTCYIIDRGCPGMATAGSGDVLSGILSGLCGWHEPSALVTACGAYLAGLAGEMAQAEVGETAMIASDTIAHLAKAVRHIETGLSQ